MSQYVPETGTSPEITKRDQLIESFVHSAKPREQWRVGTEYEKVAVRRSDGRAVPYSGPRGIRKRLTGPFQIWLNAPELGHLAQALGAHVRYKTSLSPRLSETAICVTAQIWKAHYEWFAHAPMAEKAGVKPQTIKDIQAGRTPKQAAKDELAIIDFVKEMYKTRRVSDKADKRVHAFLGDAGVVELVGICGYYAMISMALNVFRAQIPEDAALPFAEPK